MTRSLFGFMRASLSFVFDCFTACGLWLLVACFIWAAALARDGSSRFPARSF